MKKYFFVILCMMAFSSYASDFVVDGLHYNILNDTEVEVTYEKNSSGNNGATYTGDIIVPSEVSYRGITFNVTTIGKYAFASCKMESVQIPESVIKLSTSAFTGCKVKSLYLPNSISEIGDYCLADMTNVTDLHLPENNNIKSLPFHCCRSMLSLTKLDIPVNITYLGDCAFAWANSLTSVKFHNKLTQFGASCFSDCKSLEEIEFTASHVNINYYSFRNCAKLKTIKFSSSSATLNGFPDCDALENIVVYDETARPISESAFPEAVYLFGTLYVPENAIESYKNAAGWSKFRNIEPISNFASIASIAIEKNNDVQYYNLNGIQVTNPQNGIFIEVLPNQKSRLIRK